jgi:hypothetical protein
MTPEDSLTYDNHLTPTTIMNRVHEALEDLRDECWETEHMQST